MAKGYVITCMSTLAKLSIIDRAKRTKLTPEEEEAIGDLADVPECSDDAFLKVGGVSTSRKISTKERAKRAPSEYNIFISKCMKDAKIKETGKKASSVMKQCALEWKKKKGK